MLKCKFCKGNHFEISCPVMKHIKQYLPKAKESLSGASPPEVFVGRYGYPNINAGILAPQQHGSTEIFSTPEIWFKNNLDIQEILTLRSQLVYGRFKTNIKIKEKKFTSIMQDIAMASKPISTEFQFVKPIKIQFKSTSYYPIISSQAPVKKISFEENPKIEKKVEYIVDDDLKANFAVNELYNSNISISNIIKILSSGLLGLKKNKKLVPTRWSITAIDDSISKNLLKKIKTYNEIPDYWVFYSEYLGNHYEFLLIPGSFSFEVIEIKTNKFSEIEGIWQDFESIFSRKKYAENVTGAYYANRLALTEYLEKIKRQASCIVFRQITPEYWAPLGVGILRETSRNAFSNSSIKKFSTMKEALQCIQSRLKIPIEEYLNRSQLIKENKTQTKLIKFLNKIK